MIAMDHEGHQIARWFNSLGVAGVIVDYRHRGKGYGHPAPLQDAQRAIRTVRARAAEWNVDPAKIGIMGFSAGGHLASTRRHAFRSGQPGGRGRRRAGQLPAGLHDPLLPRDHVRREVHAPGLATEPSRQGRRPGPGAEPFQREAGHARRPRRPFCSIPTKTRACRPRTASTSTWRCTAPACRPSCTFTSEARTESGSGPRCPAPPPGPRLAKTGCATAGLLDLKAEK